MSCDLHWLCFPKRNYCGALGVTAATHAGPVFYTHTHSWQMSRVMALAQPQPQNFASLLFVNPVPLVLIIVLHRREGEPQCVHVCVSTDTVPSLGVLCLCGRYRSPVINAQCDVLTWWQCARAEAEAIITVMPREVVCSSESLLCAVCLFLLCASCPLLLAPRVPAHEEV